MSEDVIRLEAERVTAKELESRGYRVFQSSVHGEKRILQKRFDSEDRRLYFITFREFEWDSGKLTYDAQVCCDTDSGGYAWLTIREDTIEATEKRAELLWKACGSVYYD